MIKHKTIIGKVEKYYSSKLAEFGLTARGVDWNSVESQELRFSELLKLLDGKTNIPISVLDYGCGFGSMLDYIRRFRVFDKINYYGYDVSENMIEAANKNLQGAGATFSTKIESDAVYDFTVASGVFNVKLEQKEDEWETYVLDTIADFNRISRYGFAFNMLTSYSDPVFQKVYLYYANPVRYFDQMKREYSKYVALLHDYPLYEFTLIIKKQK